MAEPGTEPCRTLVALPNHLVVVTTRAGGKARRLEKWGPDGVHHLQPGHRA